MGYLHVYTGEGKGKTSAAFGAALRAHGRGRTVFIAQFLKHRASGEALAWESLSGRAVELYGAPRRVSAPFTDADRFAAKAGWHRVEEALAGRQYDFIVLDELCLALGHGLLDEAAVIERLGGALEAEQATDAEARSYLPTEGSAAADAIAVSGSGGRELEIICTGRHAPSSILALAGLVTEFHCRKHYAVSGQAPRLGVEF
jgi:cob(I)alamin adenosyltransferase